MLSRPIRSTRVHANLELQIRADVSSFRISLPVKVRNEESAINAIFQASPLTSPGRFHKWSSVIITSDLPQRTSWTANESTMENLRYKSSKLRYYFCLKIVNLSKISDLTASIIFQTLRETYRNIFRPLVFAWQNCDIACLFLLQTREGWGRTDLHSFVRFVLVSVKKQPNNTAKSRWIYRNFREKSRNREINVFINYYNSAARPRFRHRRQLLCHASVEQTRVFSEQALAGHEKTRSTHKQAQFWRLRIRIRILNCNLYTKYYLSPWHYRLFLSLVIFPSSSTLQFPTSLFWLFVIEHLRDSFLLLMRCCCLSGQFFTRHRWLLLEVMCESLSNCVIVWIISSCYWIDEFPFT